MSNHLKIFLIGLVLLAAGVGAGIHWLGGAVAQLAFFDPRRHDAYLVFDLVDAPPSSTRYGAFLDQHLETFAGRLLGRYRNLALLEGREAQTRSDLNVIAFAAASEVPRLLTSADYQSLFESGQVVAERLDPERRTLLGSYDGVTTEWPAVLVFIMVQSRESEVGRAAARLTETLPPTARVVWRDSFDVLIGAQAWDEMLVLGFDESLTALEWLNDDETKLRRRVLRANVNRLMIAAFERIRPDQLASNRSN